MKLTCAYVDKRSVTSMILNSGSKYVNIWLNRHLKKKKYNAKKPWSIKRGQREWEWRQEGRVRGGVIKTLKRKLKETLGRGGKGVN